MNIYSTSLLTIFFLIIFLGCYVLLLDIRDKTFQLFFLMAVIIGLWNLFASLVFISETEEVVWRRIRIGTIPAILLAPTIFWFVVSLTGGHLTGWLLLVIYGISVPLHYINWNSFLVFDRVMRTDRVWSFHFNFTSPWIYYWIIYYNLMLVFSLYHLHRWKRKTHSKRAKRQAHTIFITLLVFVVAALIGDYVLFPMVRFPPLSPAYFIIFLVGTCYAIIKFRFFSLTHITVNRDILQNLDEIVILLDEEKNISLINRRAEIFLGLNSVRDVLEKSVTSIFEGSNTFNMELLRLLRGRIKSFSCLLKTKLERESKIVNVSVSLVRDGANEALGILLVGNEILGVRDFVTSYHISNREWETIHYLLQGVSNRRIAQCMGISERTVKAHIKHIYEKLKITTRIQLLNILKEFNIVPLSDRESRLSGENLRLLGASRLESPTKN